MGNVPNLRQGVGYFISSAFYQSGEKGQEFPTGGAEIPESVPEFIPH